MAPIPASTSSESLMVIVTDHLVLREFEERGFEAMAAYQSDPRYLRYYRRS